MTNRIRNISLYDMRLDPTEADVWLSVDPEQLTSTTQVRGRLMGPRCPYSTTVEVAYPFREHSREYGSEGVPHVTLRVIIPEPSLWDPQTPFLYEGPVELWQDRQRCDQLQLRHGLRVLSLGSGGVRCNSQFLPIRGVVCKVCSEQDARRLHDAGYNTFLTPVTSETSCLGEIADQFGFLMLGRLTQRQDLTHVLKLAKHPCSLGWVLGSEVLADPLVCEGFCYNRTVGVELLQTPRERLPDGIEFAVCTEQLLPELAQLNLPKIVLREAKSAENGQPVWAATPGILGWIDLSS
jgi:hypothetical protein